MVKKPESPKNGLFYFFTRALAPHAEEMKFDQPEPVAEVPKLRVPEKPTKRSVKEEF